MHFQIRHASAPFLSFSRIFILKNLPRPSELQLNTAYTINTSEWHKSGLGMCHGNYFFFFVTHCIWGKRPLRLCLHTWHVCLWDTMIHRAPHRYDRSFFILGKASRTVEQLKEIQQMFALLQEFIVIHLKSVGATMASVM